jgi:hypothetical protein
VLAEYGDNCRSILHTAEDIHRVNSYAAKQYAAKQAIPGCPDAYHLPHAHETITVHAPACERCF